MLGAADLAASAAARYLLAAGAVNPAAADHFVLLKGPVVLQHLEAAGEICLQFDAVICAAATHGSADHVMPGLAAAAAAAADPEPHLLQLLLLLVLYCTHLQFDAAV